MAVQGHEDACTTTGDSGWRDRSQLGGCAFVAAQPAPSIMPTTAHMPVPPQRAGAEHLQLVCELRAIAGVVGRTRGCREEFAEFVDDRASPRGIRWDAGSTAVQACSTTAIAAFWGGSASQPSGLGSGQWLGRGDGIRLAWRLRIRNWIRLRNGIGDFAWYRPWIHRRHRCQWDVHSQRRMRPTSRRPPVNGSFAKGQGSHHLVQMIQVRVN